MKHSLIILSFVALLLVPTLAPAKGRPEPMPCPTDVPAALAAACPCDGKLMPNDAVAPWRNHGQYVSCVTRYRNALRKAGCLTNDLKRALTRCAARSTCGKSGAVLCCLSETGTCNDEVPGDVTPGTCSTNPATTCTTDAECTVTRARLSRDEASCVADGGTAGGSGSLCSACQPVAP